jgi:hypothetical protein
MDDAERVDRIQVSRIPTQDLLVQLRRFVKPACLVQVRSSSHQRMDHGASG